MKKQFTEDWKTFMSTESGKNAYLTIKYIKQIDDFVLQLHYDDKADADLQQIDNLFERVKELLRKGALIKMKKEDEQDEI